MPIETTLGLLGILWWLDSSHDRLPADVQVGFLGNQLSNLLTPIMTQPGRAGKFTKTQKEGADGIFGSLLCILVGPAGLEPATNGL